MAVKTRVLDTQGRSLVDTLRTLGADEFAADCSADLRFDVPLLSLPPGEYLLTIDATLDKHSVRRDVRFTVR